MPSLSVSLVTFLNFCLFFFAFTCLSHALSGQINFVVFEKKNKKTKQHLLHLCGPAGSLNIFFTCLSHALSGQVYLLFLKEKLAPSLWTSREFEYDSVFLGFFTCLSHALSGQIYFIVFEKNKTKIKHLLHVCGPAGSLNMTVFLWNHFMISVRGPAGSLNMTVFFSLFF